MGVALALCVKGLVLVLVLVLVAIRWHRIVVVVEGVGLVTAFTRLRSAGLVDILIRLEWKGFRVIVEVEQMSNGKWKPRVHVPILI